MLPYLNEYDFMSSHMYYTIILVTDFGLELLLSAHEQQGCFGFIYAYEKMMQ